MEDNNTRRGTSQSRAGNDEWKVYVQVLNCAEAALNIENALSYLRNAGFYFNRPQNIWNALMPDFNRGLALVGDSAQQLVLANQWHRDGRTTRGFWQNHISANVGTNAHQGRMTIAYGLNEFMFTLADSPEDQQLQSNRPRFKLFRHKVLADTMEALMGAMVRDGSPYWEGSLEHFMRVFELDLDAAFRYPDF